MNAEKLTSDFCVHIFVYLFIRLIFFKFLIGRSYNQVSYAIRFHCVLFLNIYIYIYIYIYI